MKIRTIGSQIAIFFLYGASVHLLLMKMYIKYAYTAQNANPLDRPWAYVAMALLGGFSVAWFMIRMSSEIGHRHERSILMTLMRGGLTGIPATIIAIAGFAILASVVLAMRLPPSDLGPFVGIFTALGFGTYGMVAALTSVPYAFLYGTLAGAYMLVISKNVSGPYVGRKPRDSGKMSLVFGIAGLILILVPFVGTILSMIAIYWAVRDLRHKTDEVSRRPVAAIVGAVLGSLGVLFLIFSFAVYFAAGRGWFGNR
jgi:hypothetical protein